MAVSDTSARLPATAKNSTATSGNTMPVAATAAVDTAATSVGATVAVDADSKATTRDCVVCGTAVELGAGAFGTLPLRVLVAPLSYALQH